MKKKILTLLLMYPMILCAQSVNLAYLKQKAKENNPQSGVLPLIQEAAEMQKQNLKTGFLPQASLGAQASYQSAVISFPIKLPGVSIPSVPKDQYKATLDLSQNIWDGGMIANQKKIADISGKIEQSKVKIDLQTLDEQINNLFYGILLSNKQIKTVNLTLIDVYAKIEKVKASIANGVAIKSNLSNFLAKKIELEQKLLEINDLKQTSIQSLGFLTGEKYDENTDFVNAGPTLLDGENKREELNFFENQKQGFLATEKLIKAKNNPKLGAFATGGYGKPGLNMLSDQFKSYFIGGVQLKIPITQFYTKSQSTEIQQARINSLKADKQKENFLLSQNIKANSIKNELTRLKKQIEGDQEIITLREEIRKTAENQLENGVITASDYLTELTNKDTAQQTMALHEIQLMKSNQELKTLYGQE